MSLKNLFETPNDRLIGITDGVYAIAMTILALELGIPAVNEITSNMMMNQFFIANLIPQIVIYLISFFIVSIFWENSLLLFGFEEVDTVIQSLNFVALALVCLIPFNTGLLFNFMSYTQPGVFFSIINLSISLLYLVMFIYVFRKRAMRLLHEYSLFSFDEAQNKLREYYEKNIKKDYSEEELNLKYPHFKKHWGAAKKTLRYMVVSPVVVSMIALVCSFFNTFLSLLVYLLMFIFQILIKIKHNQNFNFNELNNFTDDELQLIDDYNKIKNRN